MLQEVKDREEAWQVIKQQLDRHAFAEYGHGYQHVMEVSGHRAKSEMDLLTKAFQAVFAAGRAQGLKAQGDKELTTAVNAVDRMWRILNEDKINLQMINNLHSIAHSAAEGLGINQGTNNRIIL